MAKFEITGGKIRKATKVVFYGPEGIGKSTFASHFPDPLFIDTEGSTAKMNVRRLPKPTSWKMLMEEIGFVIDERPCKTLVIDTADWAEMLCTREVCARFNKTGIEDFGYGNGYTYVAEEWGRFLNRLQDVIDIAGINVVLNCHSVIRKFEQPNEMGSYDRYELKLGKKTTNQTAPLTKEWADMILFANFKIYSVAADDKGIKHKAQGGKRVMYTTHHPCWDAKNRDGLAEELPLDYEEIRHVIEHTGVKTEEAEKPSFRIEDTVRADEMKVKSPEPSAPKHDPALPKALTDLMDANDVTDDEIRAVVALKGYYPEETPVSNYDPQFIEGCLIGAWDKVFAEISITRDDMQF